MQSNQLDIKPSRYYALLLLLVFGVALLAVSAASLHGLIIVLVTIGCVGGLTYSLYRYAFKLSAHSIVKLWQEDEEHWQMMDRRGHTYKGRLSNDTYVSTHLIILSLHPMETKRQRTLVLFSDAVYGDDFRHLRTLLLSKRGGR